MNQKSIRHNMIMSVILAASGVVIPLITYPYVARVLSPEGMGKVAFAASIIFYFKLFAQLGVPTYGIREVAKARNDKERLSKVVFELTIINIFTTAVSVVMLVLSMILINKFRIYSVLFLIHGIDLVFGTLNFEWVYRGLEQFDYITKRSLICRVLVMLLTFLLVRDSNDYFMYALLTVISSFIIFIFNVKKMIGLINVRKEYFQINRIVKHMKPIVVLLAASITATIYTNIDTVMINFMSGEVDTGIYNVAIKIKTILVTVISSALAVYLPRMSRYYAEKKEREFCEALSKVLQFGVMLSFPLTLFFHFSAELCIRIIAGENYLMAVEPMKILMPTIILIGLTSILGSQVLVAMEKQNKMLIASSIAAFVNVVLNIILIPKLGITGAAITTVAAEMLVLIIQLLAIKDLLGFVTKNIHLTKTIISGCLAYLLLIIVKHMTMIPPVNIMVQFVIYFLCFGIGYAGSLLILKDSLFQEVASTFRKILLSLKIRK